MLRLLLVHESPIFRQGLRTLLKPIADIQIVGETIEREEMLAIIHERHPDVVLFDGGLTSSLPAFTAMGLVSQLRLAGGRGIFVFAPSTGSVDEEQLFQFLKHGAAAYERSTLCGSDLVKKIRQVAVGEYVITNALLQNSVETPETDTEFDEVYSPIEVQTQERIEPPVSPREVEILRHIMKGRSNKQIGRVLGISDQTVKNHITSILKKLNTADRTAAVVVSLRLKLLFLGDAELEQNETAVPRRIREEFFTPHAPVSSSREAAYASAANT